MSRLPGPARRTVGLLALSQGLAMTGNSLVLSTSALVGVALATNPALATLPVALQFLSTMTSTIPASLLMGRVGRRIGFLLGALLGVSGAALASAALLTGRFWLFCVAAVILGTFNAFANYYRFAAVDAVGRAAAGRAVSLVLLGGVLAAFAGPNVATITRTWVSSAEFAGSYLFLIGVYVAAFLVLSFVKVPKVENDPAAEPARPLRAIAAQPALVAAVISGMMGYAVMSLVMTATPLAMKADAHVFSSTAFVIQWHIVGMFAPSFVTGRLIERFGLMRVMWTGAALEAACVFVNLTGGGMVRYWTALVLLGVGWNFLFIGATTLLTRAHSEAEKSKTQGMNDFLVFSAVAAASLSAGGLQHTFGWVGVNVGAIPLIMITAGCLAWFSRTSARSQPLPA